jgi:hypothetical protein
MPVILGKPPHYLPASVNVEADVEPVKNFIAHTNMVVMLGHGITALGRSISEAYHRLNSFTAEVRRNIEAEHLAALKGTTPLYRSEAEVASLYEHADAIVYPSRAERVMADKLSEPA